MPVQRKMRLAQVSYLLNVDTKMGTQLVEYLTESKWTLLMRTQIVTVGVQDAGKLELDTRESSTKLL